MSRSREVGAPRAHRDMHGAVLDHSLDSLWRQMNASTEERPAPRTKRSRRTIDGALLDARSCAYFLGTSERAVRALAGKRIIPHRRLAGRVIFIRSEIESWLTKLPGVQPDEVEQNLALRRGDR